MSIHHTDGQPPVAPVISARRSPNRRALPFVLLALLVVALTAVFLYRTIHPRQDMITGGTLTQTSTALVFENPAEGIHFAAPLAWSRYQTPSAQVMVRGDGCSFGMLEQRTRLPVSTLATTEALDLRRRHPEARPSIVSRSIAGRAGLSFAGSYTDSAGGPMTQTYHLIDRGPNLITLIETSTAPGCATAFAVIESSLRL